MIRFSSGGGGFDPCGMAVPLMESVIPKKIKMWNSMDIRIRFSSGSRGFDPCVMAVHEFTLRWRHFIVGSDRQTADLNRIKLKLGFTQLLLRQDRKEVKNCLPPLYYWVINTHFVASFLLVDSVGSL